MQILGYSHFFCCQLRDVHFVQGNNNAKENKNYKTITYKECMARFQ